MSLTGIISNISRCSLHDGPGVRTVVYMKGCGMRCAWCHNPETFSPKKQILYIPSKCMHCGRCIDICPEHHVINGNDMLYIREGCTACGRCAEECPTLALNLCGEERTPDGLMAEIKKDAHHYAASGGGVTFSGGECLLQADFLEEMLKKCRAEGINTAIESGMHVPFENIRRMIPYTDLFFVDLKHPDTDTHRKYTGQYNGLIIENIRALSAIHNNIILRIPLIPGVNDSEADLDGFGGIIKSFGGGITSVELLRYNHLAEPKYGFVGEKHTHFADSPQSDERMREVCSALSAKCGRECMFV